MDTEIKSSHTGSLTHGKVVHALKRRVRIISPVLLKDPEKACVLEILPQKRDDIEKVSTAPDIASVVIYFDSNKLSKVTLSILLDTLLANLCTKENSQLLSINLRKWSLFRAISAFPSVLVLLIGIAALVFTIWYWAGWLFSSSSKTCSGRWFTTW